MASMPASGPLNLSRWYRSFYWRIGLSFVVFVIAVVIAQSIIFSYLLARRSEADPARSPNNLAMAIAADLGGALGQNPALDLKSYVKSKHDRPGWRVFVVMKDGTTAANSDQRLPDEIRRSAEAVLAGIDLKRTGAEPRLSGPVVTAPIQVSNELRGLVILPPPPPGGLVRDVGRLLSLPGMILLIAATTLAAVFIFAPARRRLHDLEAAAERLGSGDLAARAPESGGDEIAHLARTFNRMAGELSDRDEALRLSDRLRRQMLADVSHELKTPLTTMRGYLETLQMPEVAADAAMRDRYFDTVQRETRRLERIVMDLLELARHENGVGTLDERVFAIGRLFDHVVQRHEREAGMRRITLTTFVSESADQLLGDPDRIEQAIDNLVANALRHTPAGGTIELSAAVNDGAIRLAVVDSGEGIAPEHLRHVFDRFYKVDASRAANSGGSGLGLSIAKAVVERHGGSISVTSVRGRTEFAIRLLCHGTAALDDDPNGFERGQSTPPNL